MSSIKFENRLLKWRACDERTDKDDSFSSIVNHQPHRELRNSNQPGTKFNCIIFISAERLPVAKLLLLLFSLLNT